ncbi:unnamed protein product [Phytophthora fragariaefolia]|uniref:Unnamed protein product n=1 Tax=Phytophthora fragariaefolia TaxID=1490495 RepID=A0A9W6U4H3_9STRA|nr:unnamed protein product [Phytophthora fragariaefolia]
MDIGQVWPHYTSSPKREAPAPMGKSSGNKGTTPPDNSRSHEHKPRIAGPPGVTTETQMILRAAPDALGAAGPAEHDADAPSLSETEEMLPAPASKKHSGDPEATKGTSASKKHANDMSEEKKTPATEKPTNGAKAEENPPASPKLTAAATQKKKASASKNPTRKTTKTTASSKAAPKKPAVKKPAAKQLPNDSSDTDTPNPALVTGADSPVGDASQAPRAQTPPAGPAASANSATTPPPKRSPPPDPSLRVDNEESESDMDREAGEVEESGSSPPLTDEQ